MKVLIVGATGLVGQTMVEVLEKRKFPVSEIMLAASEKARIRTLSFCGHDQMVRTIGDGLNFAPDIALFSAGAEISKQYAKAFSEKGSYVIDNSSAWRMDPEIPLIVPEVNGGMITREDRLIANPNCSTIQFVVVAHPLHEKFKIRRVVISTYQSVTGSGSKAIKQLDEERSGRVSERFYPHPIDLNILPHIDAFEADGYTREEMKLVNETRKILGDQEIALTATAVRVPSKGGHSESVNIEFSRAFDLPEIFSILRQAPGVVVQDQPEKAIYPMPLNAAGKDDVFVGRIRRDHSRKNTLNLWIVADNLRKGAATNAIQIAETIVSHGFIR